MCQTSLSRDDLINPTSRNRAALIRGSEPEIERASARLFAMAREEELARRLAQGLHVTLADIEREQGEGNIPSYKLFASVITGRPWSVVVLDGGEGLGVDEAGAYLRDRTAKPVPKKGPPKSGLARARSSSEKNTIASVAGTGEFLLDVADILAKVPSEVVLLLKTNDLLRAMDEELGIGKVPDPSETPEESAKHLAERMQDHMVRMVTRMGWWVARTVYEGRKADFVEQERTRMPEGGNLAWRVFWRKWVSKEMLWARWEFWSVTVRLWVAEIYVGVKLALGM